jgi:hypothetical protein
MPPRPHDADEPDEARPDDADESAEPTPADLDDADVDARWAGIVSTLSSPDPRSWAPDPAVEEAETHFVPPDPGPVLGGDPLLTMAWAAVAGVPMLLMVAVIAWRDVPTVVLQVAGVAFLAGVGLLLWRMPRDREDDEGPGAVV